MYISWNVCLHHEILSVSCLSMSWNECLYYRMPVYIMKYVCPCSVHRSFCRYIRRSERRTVCRSAHGLSVGPSVIKISLSQWLEHFLPGDIPAGVATQELSSLMKRWYMTCRLVTRDGPIDPAHLVVRWLQTYGNQLFNLAACNRPLYPLF